MNKRAFSIHEQIACVDRELAIRRNVYRNRVKLGKMTQDEADYEIGCLLAVKETLIDTMPSDGEQMHLDLT